jgi:hypothetical protein
MTRTHFFHSLALLSPDVVTRASRPTNVAPEMLWPELSRKDGHRTQLGVLLDQDRDNHHLPDIRRANRGHEPVGRNVGDVERLRRLCIECCRAVGLGNIEYADH